MLEFHTPEGPESPRIDLSFVWWLLRYKPVHFTRSEARDSAMRSESRVTRVKYRVMSVDKDCPKTLAANSLTFEKNPNNQIKSRFHQENSQLFAEIQKI